MTSVALDEGDKVVLWSSIDGKKVGILSYDTEGYNLRIFKQPAGK